MVRLALAAAQQFIAERRCHDSVFGRGLVPPGPHAILNVTAASTAY